jgi:hypothetical protein
MGKGKQKITTGYIIGHTVSCSRDSTTPSASSQAGARSTCHSSTINVAMRTGEPMRPDSVIHQQNE